MTDEELIELGNRILEIDQEIRRLKEERKVINGELVGFMRSIGKQWYKMGGLSLTVMTKLYGKVCSPFVTVGRAK